MSIGPIQEWGRTNLDRRAAIRQLLMMARTVFPEITPRTHVIEAPAGSHHMFVVPLGIPDIQVAGDDRAFIPQAAPTEEIELARVVLLEGPFPAVRMGYGPRSNALVVENIEVVIDWIVEHAALTERGYRRLYMNDYTPLPQISRALYDEVTTSYPGKPVIASPGTRFTLDHVRWAIVEYLPATDSYTVAAGDSFVTDTPRWAALQWDHLEPPSPPPSDNSPMLGGRCPGLSGDEPEFKRRIHS